MTLALVKFHLMFCSWDSVGDKYKLILNQHKSLIFPLFPAFVPHNPFVVLMQFDKSESPTEAVSDLDFL